VSKPPPRLKPGEPPKRWYLHGDVTEHDPSRFYNKRRDAFERIEGYVPTWMDLVTLRADVKEWGEWPIWSEQRQSYYRAEDAENIIPDNGKRVPPGHKKQSFWDSPLVPTPGPPKPARRRS
jgi:hypothetical protein